MAHARRTKAIAVKIVAFPNMSTGYMGRLTSGPAAILGADIMSLAKADRDPTRSTGARFRTS